MYIDDNFFVRRNQLLTPELASAMVTKTFCLGVIKGDIHLPPTPTCKFRHVADPSLPLQVLLDECQRLLDGAGAQLIVNKRKPDFRFAEILLATMD